jgi:hypothetical protein
LRANGFFGKKKPLARNFLRSQSSIVFTGWSIDFRTGMSVV